MVNPVFIPYLYPTKKKKSDNVSRLGTKMKTSELATAAAENITLVEKI